MKIKFRVLFSRKYFERTIGICFICKDSGEKFVSIELYKYCIEIGFMRDYLHEDNIMFWLYVL